MSEAINEIFEQIRDFTGLGVGTQINLIETMAVIIVLVLIRTVANRIIRRTIDDVRSRYHGRKIANYIIAGIGILMVANIWWGGIGQLSTFFGLVGAGIAIALKDPITDIAGWMFILGRRPFFVGDRVKVGDHAGDVIDQRLFQFTLLEIGGWVGADQSTGRIIHVPNAHVFTEPVANYTRGFKYIWNELPVMVTFESDWRGTKEILQEIVDRHAGEMSDEAQKRVLEASRKFMIFYSTLTPTVYTDVADSGVVLTMRYLTEPRRRRGSAQAIWEDVLDAFDERDDIDFAYPTQRFYNNVTEGKPDARADLDRERAP